MTEINSEDYTRFKKLLEYFVSHLKWVVNEDEYASEYKKYIQPLIEKGGFKKTGQGYDDGQIQQQIKAWDKYTHGQICINIQPNYGSYQSSKCYLNWKGTGLNILAIWNGNNIIALRQEEYLYWEDNPSREDLGMKKDLKILRLFEESDLPNKDLIEFYQNFEQAIISYKDREQKRIQMEKTRPYIELLNYKKQIILQGPPGTGKTRLAKEIAQVLTSANSTEVLTKEDIIANCRNQISIPTAKTKLNFKILGVNDGGIRVENSEGKEHTAPYNEIVRMYENKAWEKEGMIVNGTHSYSAAVAKFLHSRRNTASLGYYKIIQFHPSYSYEDFVRGIVAESKGDKIEYKNVNKILGLFAEEALKNFQNSRKIPELISKEIWVEKQYQKFKELLEYDLEKFEEVLLKSETKPKITAIEDDAIRVNRYSNESDSVLIKDSDIINGYIGLYLTSPQIKIKDNMVLSKSARSGMYYLYQNLVEKFKKHLQDNNLSFDPGRNIEKQELNNYVLIIDEINRANLSSVLGELIYALEYRNDEVDSIYEVDGSTKLILPPNLYIIGTMNTADRSVGHIDYAIRRRFAFVNVLPEALEEDEAIYFNAAHFAKVAALFNRNNVSPEFEAKDVQLGHSYFIVKKQDAPSVAERDELFRFKMAYEVIPLLLEYVKDGILTGKIGEQDIKDYIDGLKPGV